MMFIIFIYSQDIKIRYLHVFVDNRNSNPISIEIYYLPIWDKSTWFAYLYYYYYY